MPEMNVQEQIDDYIASQPVPKRADIEELNKLILTASPAIKLWFDNGKNNAGKIVSNPSIGYGNYMNKTADGKSKEVFRIGISANSTGISVYILGIEDKTYLLETYGKTLGKATVTGYCIRFKKLKDINIDVLEAAIRFGFKLKD